MNGKRKRKFERKYLKGWKSGTPEQWKEWMRSLDPCKEYDYEEGCWESLERHTFQGSCGESLRWPLLWDLRALRDERLKTCKYLEGEIANCYLEDEQLKAWLQLIYPCKESAFEKECWRALCSYLKTPIRPIDKSILPIFAGLLFAREQRLKLYRGLKSYLKLL